jgi:hypothetical protein
MKQEVTLATLLAVMGIGGGVGGWAINTHGHNEYVPREEYMQVLHQHELRHMEAMRRIQRDLDILIERKIEPPDDDPEM